MSEHEFNKTLESYQRSFAPDDVKEKAISELYKKYKKINKNDINSDSFVEETELNDLIQK